MQIEFFLEAADADPEDQPAVADLVQGAVALGDLERMVIAEHQHVGGQPNSLRARGQVAEGRQRIPVADAAPVPLGRGQRDVLAAGQVVIAEPIGGLGDMGQVLDGGVLLPVAAAPGEHRHHRVWPPTVWRDGSSLHVPSGVDGDRLAGDGAAFVAGQEQRQVGDVLG